MVMNKLKVDIVKRMTSFSLKLITPKLRPFLKWLYSRIMTSAGMKIKKGRLKHKKDKRTIIIVNHESSATGAPILGLNLAQKISVDYNVITILLNNVI